MKLRKFWAVGGRPRSANANKEVLGVKKWGKTKQLYTNQNFCCAESSCYEVFPSTTFFISVHLRFYLDVELIFVGQPFR